MNLLVLSELHPGQTHVGWSVSYSLEETLASVCDAQFIYPLENNSIRLSDRFQIADSKFSLLQRYRHRYFKSWYDIEELPTLGKGPNILLVVGLGPRFLLSMHALGPLLKQFDLRLGYLLDGFDPAVLDRSVLPLLDHLFVMSAELVEEIKQQHGVSTSFLPLATNTLRTGSIWLPRWIDLISYGRGDQEVHRVLQRHFNQQENGRIYVHSTFTGGNVQNQGEHNALLSKLLDRSKISLCFEASNIGRFRGYSPILYRWFEAWTAGCTVVGRKPFGQGVAELMDWENSAIDLPPDPADYIPFLEDLLEDEATLADNAQRNYQEALLRHDWRYRLRDMFNTLGLPIPERLNEEITYLRRKAYAKNVPLTISA